MDVVAFDDKITSVDKVIFLYFRNENEMAE
jgi:hypothetical protein